MATKVVEVQRIVGTGHHMQNGVSTITDFHVGFFLQSIAEHLEARGILLEFVNKIKDDPVGATRANDVGKTEDVSLDAEGTDPTADQTLTGLFTGTIE